MIVPKERELEPGPVDLLCLEWGVRLLSRFIEVGRTYFSSVKKSKMNPGTVDFKVLQEIWRAGWRKVSGTPECEALGDRRRNESTVLKHVNIRAPTNPPIQALGAEPVMIARSDENRDGICRLKLGL